MNAREREEKPLIKTPKRSRYFIGVSDAFINATFPLIFAPAEKQEGAVFLVFLGWGLMETLGALLLARLGDSFGRVSLILAGAVSFVCGLGICWALLSVPDTDSDLKSLRSDLGPVVFDVSWWAFLAGALFGLADTLNNTQTFALIGDYFAAEPLNVDAFAAFQLLQAVGMASGFALSLLMPTEWGDRFALFGAQLFLQTISILGVLLLPKHTPAES